MSLQTDIFKLFWTRTGLANLFKGMCQSCG